MAAGHVSVYALLKQLLKNRQDIGVTGSFSDTFDFREVAFLPSTKIPTLLKKLHSKEICNSNWTEWSTI